MKTIVVAPHPDDEVLGVGGTLFRRKAEGAKLAWVVVTGISTENGWSANKVLQRSEEISQIKKIFGFDDVFELNLPSTRLDHIPISHLVNGISQAFRAFSPDEVFIPHPSDVHSDHRVVFEAASSCTKWFRYPSIKRVFAYETLSETDFGSGISQSFRANVFVDIAPFIENKLRAMDVYASEIGDFPFPRSHEAVRALATLRGAASGYMAAEAFELLRERL